MVCMLMSGQLPWAKDPSKGAACLQDSILVAGYPLGSGSESLSITKGIVSRVVMARYSTAQTSNKLLGVQIDAAINFGNRCNCSVPSPSLSCYCIMMGRAFRWQHPAISSQKMWLRRLWTCLLM